MSTHEILNSFDGYRLRMTLTRMAQENYPDTWEEHASITNAAAVIIDNGCLTLEEMPAGLLAQILEENGIAPR